MQEVLNELFYGNIHPNEKQFIRDSEYGKAIKIVSDCEDRLMTLLSGKEPRINGYPCCPQASAILFGYPPPRKGCDEIAPQKKYTKTLLNLAIKSHFQERFLSFEAVASISYTMQAETI